MTVRMNAALRLAGSALGALIAFACVPTAMARWVAGLAGRRFVRRHRRAARGARLRADRAAPTAPGGLSRRCPRRPGWLSAPGDRRPERGDPRTLHVSASKLRSPIRRALPRIRGAPAAGRRPVAAGPRVLGCAERRPGGEIRLQRADERAHSERDQPVRFAVGASLDEAQAEARGDRPQDSIAGRPASHWTPSAAPGCARGGETEELAPLAPKPKSNPLPGSSKNASTTGAPAEPVKIEPQPDPQTQSSYAARIRP